jgi:hypothetical protein
MPRTISWVLVKNYLLYNVQRNVNPWFDFNKMMRSLFWNVILDIYVKNIVEGNGMELNGMEKNRLGLTCRPSVLGTLSLRNLKMGWALGPLTSTFAKRGKVMPYCLLANSLIPALASGSCCPKLLHGKAKTCGQKSGLFVQRVELREEMEKALPYGFLDQFRRGGG